MVQNAMLYVWGVIFNGTNWILSAMPSADHHGAPVELFGDVGGVQVFQWFSMLSGLSISIILKRFGAITRTFINTAAICFTALIDVLFFGAEITPLELTTFGVIMLAVYSTYRPGSELRAAAAAAARYARIPSVYARSIVLAARQNTPAIDGAIYWYIVQPPSRLGGVDATGHAPAPSTRRGARSARFVQRDGQPPSSNAVVLFTIDDLVRTTGVDGAPEAPDRSFIK